MEGYLFLGVSRTSHSQFYFPAALSCLYSIPWCFIVWYTWPLASFPYWQEHQHFPFPSYFICSLQMCIHIFHKKQVRRQPVAWQPVRLSYKSQSWFRRNHISEDLWSVFVQPGGWRRKWPSQRPGPYSANLGEQHLLGTHSKRHWDSRSEQDTAPWMSFQSWPFYRLTCCMTPSLALKNL